MKKNVHLKCGLCTFLDNLKCYNPKTFFRLIKSLYRIGKNVAKFLNSVKTKICYKFLKLALLRARPSIQENGTSDVISGHGKRPSNDSPVVFCVG